MEIGLGYLSLNRPSGTLSGGEARRTKMIDYFRSSVTDVTCVFDEPTTGLHPTTSSGWTTCCCACATGAPPCSWSSPCRR
jgi:excinuclease UvrABC ATPase subunit